MEGRANGWGSHGCGIKGHAVIRGAQSLFPLSGGRRASANFLFVISRAQPTNVANIQVKVTDAGQKWENSGHNPWARPEIEDVQRNTKYVSFVILASVSVSGDVKVALIERENMGFD